MATERFLIAPFDADSGVTKNLKPWLISDTAFEELLNVYVFRGRVRKRFGTRWLGNSQLDTRLRIKIGTTDENGSFTGNLPNKNGVLITPIAAGQMFSVGDRTITLTDAIGGFVRTPPLTYAQVGIQVTITVADPFTDIYYYPATPVMGLRTFEQDAINAEKCIGFDQNFAYDYTNGWQRLATETVAGDASWSGDNSQFFWTETWLNPDGVTKVFFVTNFNEAEPRCMRTWDSTTWKSFKPRLTTPVNVDTLYLVGARILIVFKNRLIALNTWEGKISSYKNQQGVIVWDGAPIAPVNYCNRARYSQIGSPLDTDAWNQTIPGRGSAIDCPTTEAIISAQLIKDHLIVFFESSTWDLIYTGNQAYPFVWQLINTELGVESTFSVVPFDKIAIGVGNVGIHACNGMNVDRIDQKIPQEVFDIHNQDEGVSRVYGIRDYGVEMLYWSFPDNTRTTTTPFPNRVLVFNYKAGTWAFNDDSFTCFGYYQPINSITWSSTTITWSDTISWSSGDMDSYTKQIIAGNQQGYTFIVDPDCTFNSRNLQITNMTLIDGIVTVTCINHNLLEGDYIYFDEVVSLLSYLEDLNENIYKVETLIDENTFSFPITFYYISNDDEYQGNGSIARVSKISIKTKEYNFYVDKGYNAYVSRVDFLVDSTATGQVTVDYYLGTSFAPISSSVDSGTQLGSNILETYPYTTITFEEHGGQSRLWHPMYFDADGECIQLAFTMSDAQMLDKNIRLDDFQLHAMLFYVQPSASRLS